MIDWSYTANVSSGLLIKATKTGMSVRGGWLTEGRGTWSTNNIDVTDVKSITVKMSGSIDHSYSSYFCGIYLTNMSGTTTWKGLVGGIEYTIDLTDIKYVRIEGNVYAYEGSDGYAGPYYTSVNLDKAEFN